MRGLKVKEQGHWELKSKNRFRAYFWSKVDRFILNHDQNDQPTILRISPDTLGHFNFSLSLSLSWTLKSGLKPQFNLTLDLSQT